MEEEKPKKNPRGGRPPLEKKEKRDTRVWLLFTEGEYKDLKAEMKDANFKQVGPYLRMKLLARKDQLVYNPRESLNALHVLGREVGAIGKNINQIARYVNYLTAQGAVKPEIMEQYNQQLDTLTKAELAMQKIVRGFFREGAKRKTD